MGGALAPCSSPSGPQRPRARPGRGSFLSFLPLRPAGEALGSGGAPLTRSLSATSSSSGSGAPGPSGLVRQNSTSLTGKPGALPANLDDMKVSGCTLRPGGLVPSPAWPRVGAVRCSVSGRGGGWPRTTAAGGRAELQQRHLEPALRPWSSVALALSSWSSSLTMPASICQGPQGLRSTCAPLVFLSLYSAV